MSTDYQQRIGHLLDQCQASWASLQPADTSDAKHHAIDYTKSKDLHNNIKRLVHLQDELDSNETIVKDDNWRREADLVMNQVWQQVLEVAEHDTGTIPRPFSTQSTPVLASMPSSPTQRALSDTSSQSSRRSIVTMSIPEEEEVTSNPTLSMFNQSRASSNLFNQSRNPLVDDYTVIDQEAMPFNDTFPRKDLSSFAKLDATAGDARQKYRNHEQDEHHAIDSERQQQESGRKFGRRSVTMESLPEVAGESPEKRSRLRMLPLFKGLKSTQSTPLPGAPAHISFYRDEEENAIQRKEIFASDAIVSNPIRIGIGYGSYICYSCTVLSDKGPAITVRKRYSDFVDLRDELVKCFPRLKGSIPKLPPKKVVGKFTPSFVEQRRRDLEYFFKYVVLHPTLGRSPVVTHWIAP